MHQTKNNSAHRREAVADPFRLARTFQHSRQHLRHHKGKWFEFNGVAYDEIDETDLRAALTLHIKEVFNREPSAGGSPRKVVRFVNRATIANTLEALTALANVSAKVDMPAWLGKDGPRNLIVVQNGVLDVDRLLAGRPASEPHTPDWFSTTVLPYDYDPTAKAPRWEAFLNQVLDGDQEAIALLQEWFGLCLVADTSQQKFLLLTGEGSNGKSVVLEILVQLLGEANVSHVPLELFGQRFQLIETLGKAANIATEIGEIDNVAEGILKAFTSGDRMQFEAKGKQPISARPTARLVFSTNSLPRIVDRSSGIWRRMLLIPFSVVIPEKDQDKQLVQKLSTELPGILNWAIEGLWRLRAQGFTEPAVSKRALAEYRLDSNPAQAFLADNATEAPEGAVPCKDLYRSYRTWCEEHGAKPLDERQFGREVRRKFPRVERKKLGPRGNQKWTYFGIMAVTSSGFATLEPGGSFKPFVVTPRLAS